MPSGGRLTDKIRVLIADDHVVVRQGVRRFLEDGADIAVLGEAADGPQALRLVEELQPDVALLDIQMPGLNGVEVSRQIRSRFPQVKILILTAYEDDAYVFAALQAGANGYLLKTAGVDELLGAVRSVYRGQSVLSPGVTDKVVRQLQTGKPQGAAEQVERLSAREVEILRLAATGLTNKEIGARLHLSNRTVQGHLARIYGKLGVASRTEAVTEGLKRGWIVLE
jgi:DNA-binding NarL/FixJ family response regulator